MFDRKRKQNIESMQRGISNLGIMQYKLKDHVTKLEQKIKQLGCKHNFRFDYYNSIGIFQTCYVHYKCGCCDKTTIKLWDNIAKKGQQALKLLNLVPENWKTKGDNK